MTFNWSANVPNLVCRVVFTYAGSNGWSQYFSSFNRSINKGENFYVYGNAPNTATKLDVYDNSTGKILLTQNFAKGGLCANPAVTLNVSAPVAATVVTLKYQGMCTTTNIKVLPPVGTAIYFKKTGTNNWRLFHYINYWNRNQTAISTTLLTVGQSYDFYIYVGGRTAQKTYTISKADYFIEVKLPDDICKSLTK